MPATSATQATVGTLYWEPKAQKYFVNSRIDSNRNNRNNTMDTCRTACTQANYNRDISSIRDAKNSREFSNSREASNSIEGPRYNMASFILGTLDTVGNSTTLWKPTTAGNSTT